MIKSTTKKLVLLASLLIIVQILPKNVYAKTSGFLGLSIGYYNLFDDNHNASNFRAEYHPNKSIIFKKLKPWLGLELTNNASIWAGFGLKLEFNPSNKIFITPSLGIGLYKHGSSKDIDLSHQIEFRTQIEFAYKLSNEKRIAIAFSHLSNASLDKINPGTEAISLYYYTPVSWFW